MSIIETATKLRFERSRKYLYMRMLAEGCEDDPLTGFEIDYRGWRIQLFPTVKKSAAFGYAQVYGGYADGSVIPLFVGYGTETRIVPEIKRFIDDKIKEEARMLREMGKQIRENEKMTPENIERAIREFAEPIPALPVERPRRRIDRPRQRRETRLTPTAFL